MRRNTFLACLGFSTSLAFAASRALAADLWVDDAHGSDDATGAPTNPFATIARALHVARAGDTVHVVAGPPYGAVYISLSGALSAPIALRGETRDGAMPAIRADAAFGLQVAPGTHDIAITGFDIRATGDRHAIYLSPGASHIVVSGNVLHDSGGAGLAANNTDWITVSANVVARNASSSASACLSGIVLYQPRDLDADTGLHNRITGNIVFGNANTPGPGCTDTDGNGIILDDARHLQQRPSGPPYAARTLIADNLVFGNGGRGIHVFQSDHVSIVDNTLFHDNRDPHEAAWKPGEISLIASGDALVANNIAVGDGAIPGGAVGWHDEISIEDCTGGAILIDHNLLWSDTGAISTALFAPVTGAHASTAKLAISPWGPRDIWANPAFEHPTLDPATADFRPRPASPALGAGDPATTPPTDILGAAAPPHPSVGAYDRPGP